MTTWSTDVRDLALMHGLEIPTEAARRAAFIRELVEAATSRRADSPWYSAIRCMARIGRKACGARIHVRRLDAGRVEWSCVKCGERGVILGFEGTELDMSPHHGGANSYMKAEKLAKSSVACEAGGHGTGRRSPAASPPPAGGATGPAARRSRHADRGFGPGPAGSGEAGSAGGRLGRDAAPAHASHRPGELRAHRLGPAAVDRHPGAAARRAAHLRGDGGPGGGAGRAAPAASATKSAKAARCCRPC